MGERESGQAVVRRILASISAVTLSSPNFHRAGFIIHNDSTAVLWGKFDTGATSTDFTFRIDPQGSFEHRTGRVYRGLVTGLWDTAQGAAQVTELL
mgnify:FL=1